MRSEARSFEPTRTSSMVYGTYPKEIDAPDAARDWTSAEKKFILDALIKAKGRKSKAADILGWGRSTLWRKMKQHDIN